MHITKYKAIRNCFILFILYTVYYLLSSGSGLDNAYKLFSVFVYIQFAYVWYSWNKVISRGFDSYFVFSVALYVFSIGHGFLDLFGAVSTRFSLIESWGITIENYYYTEYITLSFLLAFHIGALCYADKPICYRDRFKRKNLSCELNALKNVGVYGSILSFPFYLREMIEKIIISVVYGYAALYDTDNIKYGASAFYHILGDFFIPCLICLLVYAEVRKRSRFIIFIIIFITVCLPPLVIGGRTDAVIIISIMLLIHYLYSGISKRTLFKIGIVLYCAMISMVLIRNTRGSGSESTLVDISESISEMKESEGNPITDMVSEMGWSMFCIAKTIEIKQQHNESYLYGSSFLWSFTSVIPNLFWEVHPAKEHADLSAWLTKKMNFSFGVGYSIVAESYANFGIFGALFMFFIGGLFANIFKYSAPSFANYSLIKTTISIISLWFLIPIVRNTTFSLVRMFFYYVLPIYAILIIIYRNKMSITK